jgi:hypothetical protein
MLTWSSLHVAWWLEALDSFLFYTLSGPNYVRAHVVLSKKADAMASLPNSRRCGSQSKNHTWLYFSLAAYATDSVFVFESCFSSYIGYLVLYVKMTGEDKLEKCERKSFMAYFKILLPQSGFFFFFFARLLALRPLLAYCASLR